MTKKHQIQGLDDQGNQRQISGYGSWKPWAFPADWTKDKLKALGHRPGVYMIRAMSDDDLPVKFASILAPSTSDATPDELQNRTKCLQGVLYIGKAVNLKPRFGKLVKSWDKSPPSPKHTSAINYLNMDAAIRLQYPAERIQLRCLPIGTKDWTKKSLKNGLLGLDQDWFWRNYPSWTQGHGNSRMDQTCAATNSIEKFLLCKFFSAFGVFPALNKKTPNCSDADVNEDWVNKHFDGVTDPIDSSPEANDEVEFLDPTDPDDAEMLKSARSRSRDPAEGGQR